MATQGLKKLSLIRLRQAQDYIDYLKDKDEEENMTKQAMYLTDQSGSLDFLNEEEELYSESDLKEKY